MLCSIHHQRITVHWWCLLTCVSASRERKRFAVCTCRLTTRVATSYRRCPRTWSWWIATARSWRHRLVPRKSNGVGWHRAGRSMIRVYRLFTCTQLYITLSGISQQQSMWNVKTLNQFTILAFLESFCMFNWVYDNWMQKNLKTVPWYIWI